MTAATVVDYRVTGLTCGHCVQAVTTELSALPGVHAVAVELVVDGESTVTLTADEAPDPAAVAAAVDEAGYTLVGGAPAL